MRKDDRIRLRHMLDAAREAVAAAGRRSRADLERDRVWALGLLKCLEIIGEAAARVAPETRERHSQIPWAQIVAMRNRLVHVYFDIDLNQVWQALADDLPPLIAGLEAILAAEEGK
jgi:uncharacterized protein with HEPN domain